MRRFSNLLVMVIGLAVMASLAFAGDAGSKFERMKTLAGEWQGTNPHGAVTVSYEVVANGSAVMERMSPEGQPDMITMYHMDGAKLMMTHYCSAMNQPRMVAAENESDDSVSFAFKDATNLTSETADHMRAMELTFGDADHVTHKWTFKKGDEEMAAPFELTRVKMSDK